MIDLISKVWILPFIAMAVVMFVVMANVPYKFDGWVNKYKANPWKWILYRKPFNCELCLTFWISLIYLLLLHLNPFTAIVLAGANAYLTAPLKRLL
jgi:hypothetical protein